MIVRRDAPPGVQAAMVIHAAGRSAQLPGARAVEFAIAVALEAPPDELCALSRALADAGVPHVFVHEPDEPWRGAPMAIGVVPSSRSTVRRFVAHLPLVRGKERHG